MALLAAPKYKQKLGFDPNNSNWVNDSSALGQTLMKKMGWKEGKGLGANEDGRTVPVKASMKIDNKGLGCTAKDADSWIAHGEEFDEILKSLNAGTNTSAGDSPKEKKEEGMKRFYGRFSRGGTKTSRTAEDLNCILGHRKSKVKTAEDNTQKVKTEESVSSNGIEEEDVDKSHGFVTMTRTCSVQDYFAQKLKNRNLPSHLKANEVKTNSEADSTEEKGKFKNDFVTSTCTVQDYFKQKMRAKKLMNTTALKCESSQEKQELLGGKENENEVVLSLEEVKKNIDSDSDEAYKKKKKKKKCKENSENIEDTEKVKKRKKRGGKECVEEMNSSTKNLSGLGIDIADGEDIVKNVEKYRDETGSKKKRRKEKSKAKDDKIETDSIDNFTYSREIVKGMKKQKLRNDKEAIDQEIDVLNENDEVKKTKHTNECMDAIDSSNNSTQIEAEGKKRKRKKKSKSDSSHNGITGGKVLEDAKDVEQADLERPRKKRRKADDDKTAEGSLHEGDEEKDTGDKDGSEEKENCEDEIGNKKKKKSKTKKDCVEDEAEQDERKKYDVAEPQSQIENEERGMGGGHDDGDHDETEVSQMGKNSKKKLRYKMKQNLLRRLEHMKDTTGEMLWKEKLEYVGSKASLSMKQGQLGREMHQIREFLMKKEEENSSSDDMANIAQLDEEINKCKQSMMEKALEEKNNAILELNTHKASIVKSIKGKGKKKISIVNSMAVEHQKIELNWQEEIGNLERMTKSKIAEVKKTKKEIVKMLEVNYDEHTKVVADIEQTLAMKIKNGTGLCTIFPGANVIQGYTYS